MLKHGKSYQKSRCVQLHQADRGVIRRPTQVCGADTGQFNPWRRSTHPCEQDRSLGADQSDISTRLRIWRLGVRIPRGAHHQLRSEATFAHSGADQWSRVQSPAILAMWQGRRPLATRLRPPATTVIHAGFVTDGQSGMKAGLPDGLWLLRHCSARRCRPAAVPELDRHRGCSLSWGCDERAG
jgi:hypothetical protein